MLSGFYIKIIPCPRALGCFSVFLFFLLKHPTSFSAKSFVSLPGVRSMGYGLWGGNPISFCCGLAGNYTVVWT